MGKDHRQNQKVILTLQLEDGGQDFLEIDIMENGVLLGNSTIFRNGRISLLGIGTNDGKVFHAAKEIIKGEPVRTFNDCYLYVYDTGEKEPLPWEAITFNYKVLDMEVAENQDRFLDK